MNNYPIQLKKLPYVYTELEPCISKTTLGFHHDKHLKTYVDNLNSTIANYTELQDKHLATLLSELPNIQIPDKTAIRNNGGGVFNHYFYFDSLTAPNNCKLSNNMLNHLKEAFGGENQFYEDFKSAALSQFGSGWAWLVIDKNRKLSIILIYL